MSGSQQAQPTARRRDGIAMAGAIAAHLALGLVAARLAAPAPPTASPGGAPPGDTIVFDVIHEPGRSRAGSEGARAAPSSASSPPSAPRAGQEPSFRAIQSTPGRAAPSDAPMEAARPAPGARPDPGALTGEPRPSAEGEYSGPAPSAEAALPGLGGPPVWSLPGAITAAPPAPAPTVIPAPAVDRAAATRVLEGTITSADHKKGISTPAGGITARALETAARGVSLPADSRATFEVRVGPSGELLGVRHLTTNAGDAGPWREVARRAAAALAARRIELGSRARNGAIVTVTIVSRFVYPSGSPDQTYMDLLSNKSAVIHSTHVVRLPGEKPLPADAPRPFDQRPSWIKSPPKNVKPVELKPLMPDR